MGYGAVNLLEGRMLTKTDAVWVAKKKKSEFYIELQRWDP